VDDDKRARRSVQANTWLTLGTLGIVLLVLLATAQSIRIGGGTYDEIARANALTADILPPPQYLVESHLLVEELALSPTGERVEPAIARLAALHGEYDVRHAYWVEHLQDPAQRRLLLEDGHRAASEYFRIVEDELVPAVRNGDAATVNALATGRLRALYDDDRAAVDQLVPRANQDVIAATGRSTTTLWIGAAALVACFTALVLMVGRLGRRSVAAIDASVEQAAALEAVLDSVLAQSDDLTSSSGTLKSISQSMAATAEETAAQAGVASAASEQVASTATTVAAAVEEMELSIREIAEGAAGAASTAREAVQLSLGTRETVARLGDSSMQIGGVIDVIVALTEDTNILALNATIEAARAGEAGRGFAVVANEVKELARQTARATDDIRHRVQQIQRDTSASVAAIAEVTGVVEAISDTQVVIASAVAQQRSTAQEMALRVSEVAQAAQEITGSIGSVAEAAGDTARGAAETQQAAADLTTTAAALQAVATAR
jgi:methyl-accepting chemotaxis protein